MAVVLTDGLAQTYAELLNAAPQAVPFGRLRDAGLSDDDVVFLLATEQIEVLGASGDARSVENTAAIAPEEPIALTEFGQRLAGHFDSAHVGNGASDRPHWKSANRPDAAPPEKPEWDRELRELWFQGTLVKRFTQPARNQIAILDAFQQAGWPPRIDSPLEPNGHGDPRQKLRDALRHLRGKKTARLLDIFADGTGTGIRWSAGGG